MVLLSEALGRDRKCVVVCDGGAFSMLYCCWGVYLVYAWYAEHGRGRFEISCIRTQDLESLSENDVPQRVCVCQQ